jgi:hypothetical protein
MNAVCQAKWENRIMGKKARPVGQCKLCLQRKLLANSHFLPAGIIRQCMESSLTNKNAVWVSHHGIKHTSKPIKDYVFCDKCEQRFNDFGERWTIRNVAIINGPFPILVMLEKVKPVVVIDNAKFYAVGDVPGIQIERLVHFGCGLLWKASAHRWKIDGEVLTPLALGCEEKLRQYLHGDAPFPQDVALVVSVSNAERVLPGTFQPQHTFNSKGEPFEAFKAYVSGIEFTLCVGHVPEGIMVLSAAKPPHLICATPNAQAMAEEVFGRHVKSGKLSAGMKVTLREISAIRSRISSRE